MTFNSSFREATDAIAQAATELAARQREVSSGRRLHVPSDDPTATASAIGTRAEIAAGDRYLQAADSVASRLTVVDTVLSHLADQTTAAKVAVVSARGSVANATQREAAAAQLEGIRDAIFGAMNTQFRGTYLFAGNESTTQPYERTGDTVDAYGGGDAAIEVDIDHQTAVRAGVTGDTLMQGEDDDDLFTVLDQAMAAVRAGDDAGMQASLDAFDRALGRVAAAQSRVGLDLASIDAHREQLDARRLSHAARLSALEDADMAESISAMTRADTAYRAALSAINSTQRLSLLDYLK